MTDPLIQYLCDNYYPQCQSEFYVINPSVRPSGPATPACVFCLVPAVVNNVSMGRVSSYSDDGSHGSYTLGFGSAVPQGRIVIAGIADSGSGNAIISGGSTWTAFSGGVINSSGLSARLWWKVAGASEPTTYTVTSSGDGNCCTLLEIIGANTLTNPDAANNNSNNATPPSATSTSAGDLSIVATIDVRNHFGWTAPTGWSAQGFIQESGSDLLVHLATKTAVGAGSIVPGAWGSPSLTQQYGWHILLKP